LKVLITSPYGKEKLARWFKHSGAEVVKVLEDGVKIIVPTVDEELPFFATAKEWFESKGIKVLVASKDTIDICRDKAEFYRFCQRHGFGTPVTAQFEAILKPRFGKGSKGQIRIDRSYISQEIVTWPEYSIDYYHDEFTTSIIPRERLKIVNGEATEARFENSKILIDEARRLGQELNLQYHNVMQCFFDGTQIKWIEVNPRYGGGSHLTFDVFNSPEHIIEQLKEKVE
jgi:carbamoyl-phosphate synthase large subunit